MKGVTWFSNDHCQESLLARQTSGCQAVTTTHSQSPISRGSRRRSTRECGIYGRREPCVRISVGFFSVRACTTDLVNLLFLNERKAEQGQHDSIDGQRAEGSEGPVCLCGLGGS